MMAAPVRAVVVNADSISINWPAQIVSRDGRFLAGAAALNIAGPLCIVSHISAGQQGSEQAADAAVDQLQIR